MQTKILCQEKSKNVTMPPTDAAKDPSNYGMQMLQNKKELKTLSQSKIVKTNVGLAKNIQHKSFPHFHYTIINNQMLNF